MSLQPYWFRKVNRLRVIPFFAVLVVPVVLIAGLSGHGRMDPLGVAIDIALSLLAVAYTAYLVGKYVIERQR